MSLKKKFNKFISTQVTVLIGIVTVIQGALLCLALYWGFFFNNFNPFYALLAGSGWYAFSIDRIVKIEAKIEGVG